MEPEEKAYTIDDLINKAKTYIKSDEEIELIKKAYLFAAKVHAGQLRLTGDAYILHPLNVAMILTEIYADSQTLATALLHDVINFANVKIEEIEKEFGSEIKTLVDGISKINKLSLSADNEALISYHKKILVGLSGDVRIIILKIADRLHNMRTLWAIPEKKRKEKAKETLEILVPIAHRLGINHIKSELEDLCLKYWKPDVYNDILEKLSQSRQELDKSVDKMMESVSKILTDNNIPHEMKGRTKSVYSIYNKLQKGKTFNEIYDILALRYLVNTEAECYLALGLIHAKYKPVPKRFKDYIARPKANGYQSLHTTVFGVDGKLFEIQIRTYDMDRVAEYGFASHWSYKEHGVNKQNDMEEKLKQFRTVIELNEQQVEGEEFVNTVKNEVFNSNNIYVYTPKGDVFELPVGSTPIDFAYRVHTSVGHQMVGAIVNNNIVPLDYKLKDGDIVKINTNKNSKGPSKEWLNIAYTTSAKNKIKAFFSKIDKNQTIANGKEMFIKTIRRKKLSTNDILDDKKMQIALDELGLNNENDLYYEIGIGKYNPTQVIKTILNEKEDEKKILEKTLKYQSPIMDATGEIIIDGMSDLKVSFGGCCMPVKGDDIVGYISKGNGITIHRKNCHNIVDQDERIINASWNENINKKYVTNVLIYADKKDNLLLDIISKTSAMNIGVKSVNTISNVDYNVYDLNILVDDKQMLDRYISIIKQIPSVNDCVRGNK
ncbi:MAG TPA: bifunctional (p)ppGpp synthetase/guanosine-3',5'-bis(diphosphate) 3'-pyrophosphohydrolase [Candidatus Aphodocola excrementigallinarum]|uniref:GTP diphosphokinase n=1 Tax=Candidatus Aphodocola excrementigallinarum TaxID=2840670 RepID=A0A9D1INF5_9FIRM|nr:bifunctional (p)ppGpp synthetase/guanosine-3',5'-bis(diphosphate) 3'-pyrophosphohydrolase [Candidatus Aphodocola excrementigallinarum]